MQHHIAIKTIGNCAYVSVRTCVSEIGAPIAAIAAPTREGRELTGRGETSLQATARNTDRPDGQLPSWKRSRPRPDLHSGTTGPLAAAEGYLLPRALGCQPQPSPVPGGTGAGVKCFTE